MHKFLVNNLDFFSSICNSIIATPKESLYTVKLVTYIVQNNAHKDIEWNAEEVHNGAPGLLRNVLGPHLHNGRPEYPYTSFKGTETKYMETA